MQRQAFEEIIRTHQAELYRYARYLGAQAAVAEDIVQEAFLVVLQSDLPADVAANRAQAAWLRGVTRNLFLRYCRRARADPVRVAPDVLERAEEVWKSEFLRSADGFDYIAALRKCLQTLPERDRRALDMRYAQRKSRLEMGRALNLGEDGVKSLVRRIRASLADCIRKRLRMENADAV